MQALYEPHVYFFTLICTYIILAHNTIDYSYYYILLPKHT